MKLSKNILIIGAGFSGAVAARELAETCACKIEVWDERPHLGGNCHTGRDAETGVMVHHYGPHIFNTDSERVWAYVQKFGDFRPFTNRVKALTARGVFSLPINLLTINQFFGKTFNPEEARAFISSLGDATIREPANFEEQALKMLGRDLYEAFFRDYTIKQWGCHPRELPAAILQRLPIRFSYDDNYYNRRFQGIPAEGYTEVIRRILDHPSIAVHLKKKFSPADFAANLSPHFNHLIHTGPLDAFFGYSEGRLGYRTVEFERIHCTTQDYQGNAVINYTDRSVPWTRIHEHKHFAPWEHHAKTVAFREFSKETESGDIPYYPKRLASDKTLLQRYRIMAESHAKAAPLPTSFLGRLATYRYMDMETVIGEALDFAHSAANRIAANQPLPTFPNHES